MRPKDVKTQEGIPKVKDQGSLDKHTILKGTFRKTIFKQTHSHTRSPCKKRALLSNMIYDQTRVPKCIIM